jgi:CheY-like chemotaxis protein
VTETHEASRRSPLVRDLRWALQHLYDPIELRSSPLAALLVGDRRERALPLQDQLIAAIEALKPRSNVSPQSDAWRTYWTLFHRFVGQFPQKDVAQTLAVSLRQMKRQESQALEALASYLWTHYALEYAYPVGMQASTSAETHPEEGLAEGKIDSPAGTMAGDDRQQELAWLGQSMTSEPVDVTEMVRSLARVVSPLRQSLGTELECDLPAALPRPTIKQAAARQALLNLLTAAIWTAPEGKVAITVHVMPHQLQIEICGAAGGKAAPLPDDQRDNLGLAGQLAALAGADLKLLSGEGSTPFRALVALPRSERVVLVIDDNADTLQLFERFLAGSPYTFAGARDAEQGLLLAQQLSPQVIILDVMLPGVDGWEALGRLNEHPRVRGIPIYVCTILAQEQLALSLGAAGFLRKPISRKVLLATLDRQFDLSPTESA